MAKLLFNQGDSMKAHCEIYAQGNDKSNQDARSLRSSSRPAISELKSAPRQGTREGPMRTRPAINRTSLDMERIRARLSIG